MKYVKAFLILFTGITLLNSCAKEFSLESNGIKTPAGNWEFKDSTTEFSGTMDTAFISGNSGSRELHLLGTSAEGNDQFSIILFADTITTGTYKTSLFQSVFTYSNNGIIYQANQNTGELTITITSINANLVIGSFSGMALDSLNTSRRLFDGKFKATFANANSGPVSVGLLGNSSGNCEPALISGTYSQGVAVSTGNTVQLQVTVASIGNYTITTNSVNGIAFSNSGTFTNTGVQTVTLFASGVPAFSGDQTFTAKYGNSQCDFTVTFLPGASASNDYYPLTVNNNWTYGKVNGSVSDSFSVKVISNAKVINGVTYSDLARYDVPPATANDSIYMRKENGNYYSYIDYSDHFLFDQPVYAETIILKDNVAKGATWDSPPITGIITGIPVTATLRFTILEKAIPVTLGIYSLPDVIKVRMEAIVGGMPIKDAEFWYGKNVGLIYTASGATDEFQIGRWQNF